MSVSTNDLKNGMALDLPEGLVTVVEFQHVKPGKGGAFVRTKLKNVRSGSVVDKTFRADEKVPLAVIDKREMQYLYREGNAYVFMDTDSYEQLHVDPGDLGQAVRYLKEGDTAVLPTYQDRVIGIELPAAVELTVTDTEPGVQGDRVSGARKPATLETGLVVQVPLFVEPGGQIKVDTRTGEYLARA
ncbi:MAG TPA: elongation factor P [Acidimicrobiia bacterium]|nr:elongation factor P [Acidimicrobiia bacterium]